MNAYEIQKFGGPEGLKLVDRPPPDPGDYDVVVRIKAASLNYRDLVVLRGQYDRHPVEGRIPLSDGAGDGQIDGVLVEKAVLREEGLVHLPKDYSFEEGATLPCAALTAWQSLIVRGQLVPGETVLLLGTGGVSIFGLQIAKSAGARVIITSSSDEKLERARKLGADAVINYKTTPEWGKAAANLAGSDGVDHVIEVGGAGTFLQSLRACRYGGKIGLIGTNTWRSALTLARW